MFDTMQIGKRIAELRKQNDMTQFELADRLSISFQAVSNWERGNSMPDIAKLPELAELFGVSIDQILGKSNAVLTDTAENRAPDAEAYTDEAIREAAEVMKPSQLEALVEKVDGQESVLKQALPFLSTGKVDELARCARKNGQPVRSFLPFMSNACIRECAEEALAAGEKDWTSYLTYLSTNEVDALIEQRMKRRSES